MSVLHTVNPPAAEFSTIGEEPTWHGVDIASYNYEVIRALNWHNYVATDKNFRKYLQEWVKENRPNSLKKFNACLSDISEKKLKTGICVLARMNMQGFALNEKHQEFLESYIDEILNPVVVVKESEKETKEETNKPSVQDRMRQQVSSVLSDIDFYVDEAFDGKLVEKISDHVLSQGFKEPQLKMVFNHIRKYIAEWEMAYNKEDEQLVEGYAYVPRKKLKDIITHFTDVMGVISKQLTKVKSQRIVRKKPQDKKKIASKLRFAPEFKDLNLKSVSAVDIIGADMVWVYDTKKRKLGYYEAEVKGGLYIKGATIQGYGATCVKTLRKPEEQLAAFSKLRKNQTKNWIDGIRAKCGTLTGRTNPHLILLRVD